MIGAFLAIRQAQGRSSLAGLVARCRVVALEQTAFASGAGQRCGEALGPRVSRRAAAAPPAAGWDLRRHSLPLVRKHALQAHVEAASTLLAKLSPIAAGSSFPTTASASSPRSARTPLFQPLA